MHLPSMKIRHHNNKNKLKHIVFYLKFTICFCKYMYVIKYSEFDFLKNQPVNTFSASNKSVDILTQRKDNFI